MYLRRRDFWAGLVFLSFGAMGVSASGFYALGTAAEMGPAYFPTTIGVALLAIGGVVFVQSLFSPGEPVGHWAFRPLILITVSVFAFALELEWLGLAISAFVLVLLSRLAGPEFRLKEVTALGVIVSAGTVLIFIKGLGLAIRNFP